MTQAAASGAEPAPLAGPTTPIGRRIGRLAPLAPGLLLVVLLFVIPMAFMLTFSLWRTDTNFNLVPDWNLDNYARFINVPTYLRTFVKTLGMAAIVTAAGLATALPFAYFLVRYVSHRLQRAILLAVIVPFWTSYLLRVYAWQAILGEHGALNQALQAIGLIQEPSALFIYNDFGVGLTLWYLYFPFAALALYAALEKFDFAQFNAAQDLGARPNQAFRFILLPQIRPGIITACIFVFIPILGEFLTPSLVGGASGSLIANLVVNFFRGAQYAEGSALAIVIAIFVTVVLIIFRRYLRVEDVVARG
ncbi:MAG: spermidine/putrescine transport system permease protein [Chloroflexota bacterium]|nr:spermidine/putrescine transport system permease protein [Chloroflexota bacterium]